MLSWNSSFYAGPGSALIYWGENLEVHQHRRVMTRVVCNWFRLLVLAQRDCGGERSRAKALFDSHRWRRSGNFGLFLGLVGLPTEGRYCKRLRNSPTVKGGIARNDLCGQLQAFKRRYRWLCA